ncbi:MAG TPA: FtsX-like permease family protein [Desulfomonilia bacterium]
MILKLAWRNLWRNKRRTIITLISISFGFLLTIVFTSLSDGSYGRMIDIAADMGAGHITVEPEDYRDHPGSDKVISNTRELMEKLARFKGVKALRERVVGQGMASSAADSTGMGYIAIDPEKENDTMYFFKHIKAGSGLPGDGAHALIGSLMAKQLDLRPGKKLVITTTDRHGQVVNFLVKVSGIFSTGMNEADNNIVIMPIGFVRSQIGYNSGESSHIAVYVKERWDSEKIAEKMLPLSKNYGGVSLPWSVLMPDFYGYMTMDMTSSVIFQIFIFLLISAGILNTILMGVTERMREFGIMISMGMTPGKIIRLVMAEAFWLAVAGLVAGFILTAPVYWYLHVYGIDFSIFLSNGENTIGGIIFEPLVKGAIIPRHLANIIGAIMLLIMTTGLYPAFLAARTNPVETIKII